jgi:hypothetical protein
VYINGAQTEKFVISIVFITYFNLQQLPIGYMAVESLTLNENTIESEIWTFGIVLWELFTFGMKMPYEEQIPDFTFGQLVNFLTNGGRLNLPEIAPTAMYVSISKISRYCYFSRNLMLSTWSEISETRPSFNQCKSIIRNAYNNANESVCVI